MLSITRLWFSKKCTGPENLFWRYFIDKFNDLSKRVLELNNKLNDVIGNLKSLGTTNNIDGLHLEIVELQKQINELKK